MEVSYLLLRSAVCDRFDVYLRRESVTGQGVWAGRGKHNDPLAPVIGLVPRYEH